MKWNQCAALNDKWKKVNYFTEFCTVDSFLNVLCNVIVDQNRCSLRFVFEC